MLAFNGWGGGCGFSNPWVRKLITTTTSGEPEFFLNVRCEQSGETFAGHAVSQACQSFGLEESG
jgi:hypothetical protein